jgi:outer membrane immunogenic protein
MLRTLTLTGLSAVLAVPAFAGSPVYTPAPEPVIVAAPLPVWDWTGAYIGGQVGYGWGTASVDLDDDISLDTNFDGWLGGLHAGYNYDFGTFVLGGEVDYDWADLQFDDDDIDGSIDQIARAKLKLGYDLGQTLIYGVAGWAWANAEAEGENYSDDTWLVGAGATYRISDAWSAGGEYLYHGFRNGFDDTGIDDMGVSTITARMSYNF